MEMPADPFPTPAEPERLEALALDIVATMVAALTELAGRGIALARRGMRDLPLVEDLLRRVVYLMALRLDVPAPAPSPAAPSQRGDTPTPSPDAPSPPAARPRPGLEDRYLRRAQALADAVANLDAYAMRMARWIARQASENAKRLSPLAVAPAPEHAEIAKTQPAVPVLSDLYLLVLMALGPDTS
ncbi:hypothetical protein [Hyphomonas sp.]|jgi:hypothetical protein|uniref:hypothetical protein n=1 Tax=Hyphomonas sp. TaxID=87 RepID=UPI0032D93FBF